VRAHSTRACAHTHTHTHHHHHHHNDNFPRLQTHTRTFARTHTHTPHTRSSRDYGGYMPRKNASGQPAVAIGPGTGSDPFAALRSAAAASLPSMVGALAGA
jgi:hypothetical protein